MGANTWIFAAVLATGQVAEMPMTQHYQEVRTGCSRSGWTTTQTWTQTWTSSGWRPANPSMWDRVRGFFGGSPSSGWGPADSQGCACGRQQGSLVPSSAEPLGDQVGPVLTQVPLQAPLQRVTASEPPLADAGPELSVPEAGPAIQPITFRSDAPAGQQLSPRFADKLRHEEDYSAITGQLFRVNGRWLVRYAVLGVADAHGGNVVLTPEVDLSSFREGDLVSVRGQVLNPTRPALPDAGPYYRPTSVELIER